MLNGQTAHLRPLYPPQTDTELIRRIAGTIARSVEGVAYMGEGLLHDFDCPGGGEDPGRGVTVRLWQDDLWLYIHLAAMPGMDTESILATIRTRVTATLHNLLGLTPGAIEFTLQGAPDAIPVPPQPERPVPEPGRRVMEPGIPAPEPGVPAPEPGIPATQPGDPIPVPPIAQPAPYFA